MPEWITRIVIAAAAVIVVLLFLTWLLGGYAGMSIAGDIALTLGIIITVALGIGLMTLVFYSSRSKRDEAVHQAFHDRR